MQPNSASSLPVDFAPKSTEFIPAQITEFCRAINDRWLDKDISAAETTESVLSTSRSPVLRRILGISSLDRDDCDRR
jgi:hypothetical protein